MIPGSTDEPRELPESKNWSLVGPRGSDKPNTMDVIYKVIIRLLIPCVALIGTGCGEDSADGPAIDLASEEPGDEEEIDPGESAAPLYLELKWRFEDTEDDFQLVDTCEVSPSAARGSTTTCEMWVEEGKLHYSDLKFIVGTNAPDTCTIIKFRPYYYVRSTSATYTPAGASADEEIDCSALNSAKCFGGAAPTLLGSDFPNFKGRYFLSANQTAANFSLPSEGKTRWYYGSPVNYLVTNDLTDKSVTLPETSPKSFVSSEPWVDYTVMCEDTWGYTYYTLELIIHDEDAQDSDPDAEDDYDDWD